MEPSQPPIDLFASRGNNKVKTFYSFFPGPLASGVDAFYYDWSQGIIYVFSSFNLIPLRVLQKKKKRKNRKRKI